MHAKQVAVILGKWPTWRTIFYVFIYLFPGP